LVRFLLLCTIITQKCNFQIKNCEQCCFWHYLTFFFDNIPNNKYQKIEFTPLWITGFGDWIQMRDFITDTSFQLVYLFSDIVHIKKSVQPGPYQLPHCNLSLYLSSTILGHRTSRPRFVDPRHPFETGVADRGCV